MAAQSSITLVDDVPTNHIFVPAGSRLGDGGVITSLWEDPDHSTAAIGMWTLTERFTKGTGRSTVDTAQFGLAIPGVQTVDGVAQVLYVPRFEGKFFMPKQAPSARLRALAHMAGALITSSLVHAVVGERRASW